MPGRTDTATPSPGKRGLACFGLALASAAITIWATTGGFSTPMASAATIPEEGVPPAGNAPDGVREVGGVLADGDGRNGTQEGKNRDTLAVDVGEGAGDIKQPFSAQVGQIKVVATDSLDFSTEDPWPGLMWLPIGLHEVSSGDPWVTMCLIDYGHYQENPAATPMYAHLNSYSKCGRKPSARITPTTPVGKVELVRMSSLMQSMKSQGREPLPPKGFVYHETRCGSTLVANMLASLPPSRVFSESKPPTQAIRECIAEGCDRAVLISVVRDVVALMGRRRSDEKHEHLYFKFQNSKFLPELSEAYPAVPWVFVFRDPVEVMVSNLKSFGGAPCVRIPRQEKLRKDGKLKANGALPKGSDKFGGGRGKVPRGTSLQKPFVGPGPHRRGQGRRLAQAGAEVVGVHASAGRGEGTGGGWDGEGDWDGDVFGSVSWNGVGYGNASTDWGLHHELASPDSSRSRGSPGGVSVSTALRGGGGGALDASDVDGRRLVGKKAGVSMTLTPDMTMECADWLQSLCVSAVNGGKDFPAMALFVDYANLPDAVPEYVFPQHFDMAAEVEKTVPDWRERMFKAAGSYSKGMGKTKGFASDAEAKHKQASPIIVETSNRDGGLYEIYRSLDGMQTWRRPEEEAGGDEGK